MSAHAQPPLEALRADKYGFWRNVNPKCPHCGSVLDISERGAWDLYEEGQHWKTCESCDLEFVIQTHVSYSFSTDDQEDA